MSGQAYRAVDHWPPGPGSSGPGALKASRIRPANWGSYKQDLFAQTIRIAMRAGQDSDCNPSSAASVLGTWLGRSRIPPRFRHGIAFDEGFTCETEVGLVLDEVKIFLQIVVLILYGVDEFVRHDRFLDEVRQPVGNEKRLLFRIVVPCCLFSEEIEHKFLEAKIWGEEAPLHHRFPLRFPLRW